MFLSSFSVGWEVWQRRLNVSRTNGSDGGTETENGKNKIFILEMQKSKLCGFLGFFFFFWYPEVSAHYLLASADTNITNVWEGINWAFEQQCWQV